MDANLEIARLQKEISQRLGLSAENLIFEYENAGDQVRLDLITVNPRHDQSFLYHSCMGETKGTALQNLLAYVVKNYREEQSYTVQWKHIGEPELQTSYFRARSMFEVLSKFSHGREMSDYVLYSITLNPIS